MKTAVQLYSCRDGIKDTDSLLKALDKVKEIGYEGVEFAGYFDTDASVIREKLDSIGLVCVGGHIGIDDFAPERLEKTLEFQKTLGALAVGVGGAPHSTVAESENTGKILGDADKIAFEKYGMRTYYHNHSEEFAVFEDGSRSIDIIGSFCPLEIDTYWSHHAGIDNYSFLTENKDRIIYYHVKDGVGGKPRALGEGDCDVKAVIKAAKDNNVEWIIVENDDPVPTGFEDITRSLAYLKSIM